MVNRPFLLGVDIGGTFVDLVRFDLDSGAIAVSKAPSTPDDLTAGIRACLDKSETRLAEVDTLFHGSTMVINTIVERSGARTGLVTTRGFRDVLEIGRGNRPINYDLFYEKPDLLVPRHLRFEVDERLDNTGRELIPVDLAALDAVVAAAGTHGLEAIAICFLHAYANPAHEEEVRAYLQAALPDLFICASNEVVREWREFERSSTTVLNAYVGPRVERYVRRLEEMNAGLGFAGRFYLMQSSGGVMTPARAKRLPVAMVESGPVSGMIGAAHVCQKFAYPLLIGFDMGGTTAKTALIEDGLPSVSPVYYVGGYAHGYPLLSPTVEVVEVGTGGGSMAWIDPTGALKVGPRSAGSEPGPVCVGNGGTEPTVTDANALLGRINTARYLGGEISLDLEGARAAIQSKVAEPFGLDLHQAAAGILTIADSNMSLAVRGITLEKGLDPRDAAMIAFGGGGPLHAMRVARDIGIPKVIVPTYPACFSALGMLLADLRHDLVRTFVRPFPLPDHDQLTALLDQLRAEGRDLLAAAGVAAGDITCAAALDLRYRGQHWTLTTPVADGPLTEENAGAVRAHFNRLYEARYGHSFSHLETEVVNLRVVALGRRRKPAFPALSRRRGGLTPDATRKVYFDGCGFIETPIYLREKLRAGDRIAGPAIVEEADSTTLLFAGDAAEVDEIGFITVHIDGDAK